jgi:probable rRNA maturation factor
MLKVELVKKVKAPFSPAWVNKQVGLMARRFDRKIFGEISLVLVSDREIKKLNARYRQKNKVTDVLSFAGVQPDFVSPDQDFLGEIVISYPQAVRQAKANQLTVRQEIRFLLAHALLHLLGFDHEKSRAEEKKMEDWQKKLLGLSE